MNTQSQTVETENAVLSHPLRAASSECNQFCMETIGLQGMGVLAILLCLKLPASEILPDLILPQVKVIVLALCAGILIGWVRIECLTLGLLSAKEAMNPLIMERLGLIGGILLLISSVGPFILATSCRWSELDRRARRIYAITATLVYSEIVLFVSAVVSLIYFVWGFYSSTPFG